MTSEVEKCILSVKLAKELHRRTKVAAAVRELTLSDIVTEALELLLSGQDSPIDVAPAVVSAGV